MLHGIDISNWQMCLKIPESVDFCIVKATEGVTFVDKCCDSFVSQCKSKGILWGFYHFMTSADPEAQAVWLADHTAGYAGLGIPVLDIESEKIKSWGDWAQRFVDKYHAITSVYPIIYTSAAYLGRFAGYPLVQTCGLWVAGYPSSKPYELRDQPPTFTYSVKPWKFAALWQYSAKGTIPGWQDYIDLDVAFMDSNAWHLYAQGDRNDQTQVIQVPVESPGKDPKSFHFDNDLISVDVTLKGGNRNGA
jgi:lysozyme